MTQEAKILFGITAGSILLILGGVFFLGKSTPQSDSGTTKVSPKLLVRNNSHITGNEKAKVTVVEFGDYECPACGAVYPVTKQLVSKYGTKIRFVFRNFPLPQHPNAQIAAEAAEAAEKQGKFWQMHDLLYEKQQEWAESSSPINFFTTYAKRLGLNIDTFTKDVQNNAYSDIITQDQNDGNTLGVDATPTFYINNEKFTQYPTIGNFENAINPLLKK